MGDICNELEDLNVLMKVSEKCPLACTYCYEGDKGRAMMSDDTLKASFEKLESRPGALRTNYIWHGAEPLTAGSGFYKRVKELQMQYEGHKIRNSMQSNGVLLTPELADFFVAEGFDIGFSLDGPKELHDQTRPYISGRSSFADTMKAISLMRERGKSPGIIAVLTKKSLPYLDEMYEFFKAEGLGFKINPLIACGSALEHDELALMPKERADAICHLFDRWFYDEQDNRRVDYGNMTSLARAIFTKGGSSCDMLESCQDSFLSIGADGRIYPCSRYDGPEVAYGNIHTNTIEDIIASPQRQRLLRRFENLPECVECEYSIVCYSGCMHNAHVAGDIMQKDPACGSNKIIYEHISRRILEQLEKDNAIRS